MRDELIETVSDFDTASRVGAEACLNELLARLRDPTPAMLAAGGRAFAIGGGFDAVWKAMIDAIGT